MGDRAKLFWSGHDQAVRLTKKYRFESSVVRIYREGNKVVIEPFDEDSAITGVRPAVEEQWRLPTLR